MLTRYSCIMALLLTAGCNNTNKEEPNIMKEPDLIDERALVYIDDGAIQCDAAGMTPEESSLLLTNKGIDVIASHCAYLTGVFVITVCGAGDTNINVHEINIQNIPDAQEIGFSPVTSLEQEIGYKITDCPEQ